MLQLYENIRKIRIERNMTQSELAKRVGYADKTMVAKIEAGQVDLSQTKIEKFAKALSTTTACLLGEDSSWSSAFRKNLADYLQMCAKEDVKLACNTERLYEIAYNMKPFSFEDACEIVDEIGGSFDSLLGREDLTTMGDDEVLNEAIYCLSNLSTEKLSGAMEYLRFLSKTEDK